LVQEDLIGIPQDQGLGDHESGNHQQAGHKAGCYSAIGGRVVALDLAALRCAIQSNRRAAARNRR
jgi:hypothetical protein